VKPGFHLAAGGRCIIWDRARSTGPLPQLRRVVTVGRFVTGWWHDGTRVAEQGREASAPHKRDELFACSDAFAFALLGYTVRSADTVAMGRPRGVSGVVILNY